MKKSLAFITIILLLQSCSWLTPRPRSEHEGELIPEFILQKPDTTQAFSTSKIPSGKPFALYLYEPYCMYSRGEMADILNNISDFRHYDLYLITTYPWTSARQFSKFYNLNKYPNIILARDSAGKMLNYFKAPGVPYLAFYNEQKVLRRVLIGKNDYTEIQKLVKN